ncbi:MAG: thioredoxin family protein [Pyrinomonadaceae bacterium]|nr:thioredoxin family protein [Pyrinomonadaceae bacterium]
MKKYIEDAMSYTEFNSLIDGLLTEGKTTGDSQDEAKVNFTRLNRQRMQRLDKTIEPTEEAVSAARSVERPMVWLTIAEGWCGDGAQNIPVIEKFASESDKIQTRYILRDEHPELMDRFLTNGSRSIPKLIAIDAENLSVLGTWGTRPEAAKSYFAEMKAEGIEKDRIAENLQRWYNADKGRSLMAELAGLTREWQLGKSAAATMTN